MGSPPCGHDFLHGRLLGKPKNAEALAAAMIAFCPDTVDQAGAEIRLQSRPAQIQMLAGISRRAAASSSVGLGCR